MKIRRNVNVSCEHGAKADFGRMLYTLKVGARVCEMCGIWRMWSGEGKVRYLYYRRQSSSQVIGQNNMLDTNIPYR